MAVAHRAVRQWRACVGAFGLIGAYLFSMPNQHHFRLAHFNLNTAISTKIGQARDSMHWHVTYSQAFFWE
jgi:hypothetical protein